MKNSKAQVLEIFSLTSYGIKLIQHRLKDRHLKKDHDPPFDPIENHSIPNLYIKIYII